jgi:F-box-like
MRASDSQPTRATVHASIRFPANPMDVLITSLPQEIILFVFSYLSAEQLALISGVSRAWRLLASDDALWRQHIERRFRLRLPLCAEAAGGTESEADLQEAVPPTCKSLFAELLQDQRERTLRLNGETERFAAHATPLHLLLLNAIRASSAEHHQTAENTLSSRHGFWRLVLGDRAARTVPSCACVCVFSLPRRRSVVSPPAVRVRRTL